MNIHDMTEQAYKNGYEAGVKSQQAEIEKLKGMVGAELDTIHKLGDDYGRALEEHSIITAHLNAEIDRLHSIIKELAGD